MSKNSTNSSSSIGILGLLGVVFVTLKLCNVITWSWWLVTLPFWAGFAFLVIAAALIVLFVRLFK